MMEALLTRLDPRQQRLILIAVVAIIAAALFSYLLIPEIKKYNASVAARTVLEKVADSGDDLSTQTAKTQSAIDELGRKLHGDLANLPAREIEAHIIGRLQKISWRNNVELVSVEPGIGDTVEMFREILFRIELSGDYFDLFAWLQDAEQELGYVVVKQYEMQPQDVTAESPNLSVRLTMASYKRVRA